MSKLLQENLDSFKTQKPEFIVNGYYPSSDSLLVIDGREYKKGEGNKEFQITKNKKTEWEIFMRILKGTDQEVIDTLKIDES